MILYKINNSKMEVIDEKPFKKEMDLHRICEENLENIFGLRFVKREFYYNNFRLDTLAFDEANRSA